MCLNSCISMATHIKHILPNLLARRDDWHFELLANWHAIVGNLSSKMTLEKIQGDTLVIGVFDSCWLQELYLMSSMILTRINQKVGHSHIKQLRFKKAEVKKQVSSLTQQKKVLEAVVPKPLTTQEQSALDALKDPELRDILRTFLMRCQKEPL